MPDHSQSLSRRAFIGGATALAASMLVSQRALAAESKKPDSNFGGVWVGTNTYSYRSMPKISAEDLLGYLLQNGLSTVELKGEPAEEFAKRKDPKTGPDGPLDAYVALGKMYRDAGVDIHIVKFGNIGDEKMSDKEVDYYFRAAKATGAKAITRELSEDAAKRLGPLADKHGIIIAFHNHMQIKPDTYDGDILSHGKLLRINLDIGHYVAGTNESPIPFIEKHHEKIYSMHLKDRKKNKGDNTPWGQGDTPITEVLQLVKKNKFSIFADIELEYTIPQDSDAVKEMSTCVDYCKKALA
jgi:hypothetical protein